MFPLLNKSRARYIANERVLVSILTESRVFDNYGRNLEEIADGE